MRRAHLKIMRAVHLLAGFLACASFLPAQETFPSLKAANLSGKEMQLPQAFEGEFNLVLVAFQREQQKDVDTWLKQLPNIAEKYPKLRYYELPTISKLNALTRWFISNGMRSGIPDKKQRERTITLFIDKKPFKEALKITSEDTIYALLLNRSGEVVWRGEGLYSEEKGRLLEQFLSGR